MKTLKGKASVLAIVGALLVGGGTAYATASMFDELKDDYHNKILSHVESFVPTDQSKRIQEETQAYLEKKLAERDKRVNDVKSAEADQTIEEIKQFIDNEIESYNDL